MRLALSYYDTISFESGNLRRAVAFTAVVALHVGMIAGLARWTASRDEAPLALPLEVQLLTETVVPEEPPPPPVPPPMRLDPVLPDVPIIEIAEAPTPAPNAITVAVRPQPQPVHHTAAPVQISEAAYVREPRPVYPTSSRREHEHGIVVLRVLIGIDGSAARVEIHNSSGYERLDRAAREAVLRALFRPYVENGIARPAMVLVPIEFELNTRVARREADSGHRNRHSLDATMLTEPSP